MIVVSSTILILPVVVGFIQIFVRNTKGIHASTEEKGIQEYYKIATSNRNNKNDAQRNVETEDQS